MTLACIALYLVTGVIVLEFVRPSGEKVPPGGVLRNVLLWPVTVFIAIVYVFTHARKP